MPPMAFMVGLNLQSKGAIHGPPVAVAMNPQPSRGM